MSTIIKKLWNGELNPCNTPYGLTKEYERLLDACENHRQRLLAKLGKENEAALEKYDDACVDITSYCSEEAFSKGFSLGAMLMLEVIESPYYERKTVE